MGRVFRLGKMSLLGRLKEANKEKYYTERCGKRDPWNPSKAGLKKNIS